MNVKIHKQRAVYNTLFSTETEDQILHFLRGRDYVMGYRWPKLGHSKAIEDGSKEIKKPGTRKYLAFLFFIW
ncbi:MAG: hypothetical protein DBP02_06280 [gamma proteobacterium symbiont of Ctena orbiculata]|nr:MAG: hypothetical protein DBP02_06280 [gamma proteobacterium symbiont of Ctena orbiculata]